MWLVVFASGLRSESQWKCELVGQVYVLACFREKLIFQIFLPQVQKATCVMVILFIFG